MGNTTVAQFEVAVLYNGVAKEVTVNPKQAVRALLQHALNEFGIQQDRQNFGLFLTSGQAVNSDVAVEDAGISPGTQLLLRPRRVSGGTG